MIRYKLVTQDFKTRAGERNETVWTIGTKHTALGDGSLYTDGVIHSYESPELAVLLNPIHAAIKEPRLIEIECSDLIANDGLKGGHKSATMIREIPLPTISQEQRVIFAILCVRSIPNRAQIAAWEDWADNYLSGTDRGTKAAYAAAAYAAYAAADAAYAQGIKIDFAALAHTACNTKNPTQTKGDV